MSENINSYRHKRALLIASASDGKFFSAKFIKKNGKERSIVAKLIPGPVKSKQYIRVLDVRLRQYRTINISTLKQLKSKGQTIVWG